MGTIQNSMNQMLGTVAGATTMAKHLKNQKESITKQEEANKQAKLSDRLNAIEKAEGIELQTQQEIDRFNEINKEELGIEKEASGLHTSLSDKKLRTSKGQFYSQKALQEMQDRLEELRLQKFYQENRIKLLDEKRDLIGKLGVEL